ncbi:WHG domain-containing protein [Nocardioides perillae]|uniref:AcrR family transcriptional regulator n=1 Tax=Nocardioides perillae TaxID=1119534 RepID=A0A7Y9RTP6_9ACTN|nr:AcrR family transcriptional regulator [Nocardioides perillae]
MSAEVARGGQEQVERGPDGRFPTRRERLRQEVREDLKRSARDLLVPHSTGELSLRAVARDVGIAPSGIYRYFASRQELVAAVAADAFSSAAAALHASAVAHDGLDLTSQALAMAHAYRRWCLSHRAEFSLMFGTDTFASDGGPVPDPSQLHEFFAAPLVHFARCVRAGVVDTGAAALQWGSPLVAELEEMRRDQDGLDEQQVGVLLSGWASFHGYVSLEVYGPLSWFYADLDTAWDAHARGTLRAMGYRGVADAVLPEDAGPTPP